MIGKSHALNEDFAYLLAADTENLDSQLVAADTRKLRIFTEQWTRIQLPVRAYLASFLGNSVAIDDCIQEVAVVVWKKGPWEAGSPAFLGYTLACAKRVALAARRRQNDPRMQVLSPAAASALADTVVLQEQEESQELAARISSLRRCLAELQPVQRELLEARYSTHSATELSHHAAGAGKSMDCLYKKLERLREILRTCVNRRQSLED